ncbi:hypothetical protein [Streptomyces sp. MBT67]|uniref:hypothetical protein n=1 Tax=Streptomyces sp. MBT67 TaxID=1488397 RepID=UPI001F3865E6|nr:hypothetical protein [Streptomyces sp. MBT67]
MVQAVGEPLAGQRRLQRVGGRRARQIGPGHQHRPLRGEGGQIAVEREQEVHDPRVVDDGVGAVGEGQRGGLGSAAQPDQVRVVERQVLDRALQGHRAGTHVGEADHLGQQSVRLPPGVLPVLVGAGGGAQRSAVRGTVPDREDPVQEDAGAVRRDQFGRPRKRRRCPLRVGQDLQGSLCGGDHGLEPGAVARGKRVDGVGRFLDSRAQGPVQGMVGGERGAERVLAEGTGDQLALAHRHQAAGRPRRLGQAGHQDHLHEVGEAPDGLVVQDAVQGLGQDVVGQRGALRESPAVGLTAQLRQLGHGLPDLLRRHQLLAVVGEVAQLREDQRDVEAAAVGVQGRIPVVVHVDRLLLRDGLALGGAPGQQGGGVLARGGDVADRGVEVAREEGLVRGDGAAVEVQQPSEGSGEPRADGVVVPVEEVPGPGPQRPQDPVEGRT